MDAQKVVDKLVLKIAKLELENTLFQVQVEDLTEQLNVKENGENNE